MSKTSKAFTSDADYKVIGQDLAEEVRRLVKEAVSRVEVKHIAAGVESSPTPQFSRDGQPLDSDPENVVTDALVSDVVSAIRNPFQSFRR